MEQTPYLLEDEIDLRQYVVVLVKYWYWIIGLAGAAAVAAFIATSFLPKTYESRTDVLILESKTEITLDPQYQTVIDELDAKSSQQTLVSLVKSSDVAADVLAQSGDLLSPEERSVKGLLARVTTSNNDKIISIVVSGQSPEQAAGLANLWATTYIDYVNNLYNTQKGTLLVEVKGQITEVQQRYQSAQTALENFLADNRIGLLNREIEAKKQQAQALRNRVAILETTPLFLFELQQDTQRQILAGKYDKLKRIESWLEDATALKDQLEVNPDRTDRPENLLALLLIRAQMSGSSSNPPVSASSNLSVSGSSNPPTSGSSNPPIFDSSNLSMSGSSNLPIQLQLSSSSNLPIQLQLNPADLGPTPVTPADMEQLIAGLNQQHHRLTEEIEQLSATLLTEEPTGPETLAAPTALSSLLTQLDADILTLEAELETQQAQQRELTETRDLAWENLNTVRRKVTEVELSSQMTNARLLPLGTAIPPENSVEPRRLVNTVIAGVLGLMLAVFVVFAREWWRGDMGEKAAKE